MNPLERALIEKAGNEHGFEYVLAGEPEAVSLGSARHQAIARVSRDMGEYRLTVSSSVTAKLAAELARGFPDVHRLGEAFVASDIDGLARLLRRTAALAHALPMGNGMGKLWAKDYQKPRERVPYRLNVRRPPRRWTNARQRPAPGHSRTLQRE